MVTDTADARKVDKKTALALWDQTVPPPVVRKKRVEDSEDVVADGGDSATKERCRRETPLRIWYSPESFSSWRATPDLAWTLPFTEWTSVASRPVLLRPVSYGRLEGSHLESGQTDKACE